MLGEITKQTVDKIQPGERDVFLWDTKTKGFGLKVTPAGKKVYIFQYRWPGRPTPQKVTLGKHGDPWTPSQARKQAEVFRAEVHKGSNPRDHLKAMAQEEAIALTVKELCDRYLRDGCKTKKASTIGTDKGRICRHIIPLLGKRRVKDITSSDIRKFMNDVAAGKTAADVKTGAHGRARVTGGKGTASRTVGLLGGIFSFAVEEGIRTDNPVKGVKRFRDKKNERYLSEFEYSKLGQALREAEAEGENKIGIAAIKLLMLTGCRKSEVLTLHWSEVDVERRCLRLKDSKTYEKVVPLGATALQLIKDQPRFNDSDFVFPSMRGDGHLVGLPRVWKRIAKRAGLEDVRLHDLRHSFASVGAGAGQSLYIVGALLGHKDAKTTARYAHLADDPAQLAADQISGNIAKALGH